MVDIRSSMFRDGNDRDDQDSSVCRRTYVQESQSEKFSSGPVQVVG